jgi:hypothetical protein
VSQGVIDGLQCRFPLGTPLAEQHILCLEAEARRRDSFRRSAVRRTLRRIARWQKRLAGKAESGGGL